MTLAPTTALPKPLVGDPLHELSPRRAAEHAHLEALHRLRARSAQRRHILFGGGFAGWSPACHRQPR